MPNVRSPPIACGIEMYITHVYKNTTARCVCVCMCVCVCVCMCVYIIYVTLISRMVVRGKPIQHHSRLNPTKSLKKYAERFAHYPQTKHISRFNYIQIPSLLVLSFNCFKATFLLSSFINIAYVTALYEKANKRTQIGFESDRDRTIDITNNV